MTSKKKSLQFGSIVLLFFYILSTDVSLSNITFSFNIFTESEFHTYNFIKHVSLFLSIQFSFLFLLLDTVYWLHRATHIQNLQKYKDFKQHPKEKSWLLLLISLLHPNIKQPGYSRMSKSPGANCEAMCSHRGKSLVCQGGLQIDRGSGLVWVTQQSPEQPAVSLRLCPKIKIKYLLHRLNQPYRAPLSHFCLCQNIQFLQYNPWMQNQTQEFIVF